MGPLTAASHRAATKFWADSANNSGLELHSYYVSNYSGTYAETYISQRDLRGGYQ